LLKDKFGCPDGLAEKTTIHLKKSKKEAEKEASQKVHKVLRSCFITS